MTRILWDTFLLISGSLFTLGAGPSSSAVVKSAKASSSDSAAAGTARPPAAVATAANIPPSQRFLIPSGAEVSSTVAAAAAAASVPVETTFPAALSTFTGSSAGTVTVASAPGETFLSTSGADLKNSTAEGANGSADTTSATVGATSASPAKRARQDLDRCLRDNAGLSQSLRMGDNTSSMRARKAIYRWNGVCDKGRNATVWIHPGLNATVCVCPRCWDNTDCCLIKSEFVAAAVWSHFAECPDSHRHFCFHGTCRFLTLEETAACVCHQGFVGMRCEHADLLAVVATNHRQTVTTVLVMCVIGCVLVMVLCTLLHCWWRQECRRQRQAHHYCPQKHGVSFHPSESVV